MSRLTLIEVVCYPIRGMSGFQPATAQIINKQLAFDDTLCLLQIDGSPLDIVHNQQLRYLCCKQDSNKTQFLRNGTATLCFDNSRWHHSALAPLEVNRWLSLQLGSDLQLFNKNVICHDRYCELTQHNMPASYRLVNLANQPFKDRTTTVANTAHFIIDTTTPFIEQTWEYLKIAEVIFQVRSPRHGDWQDQSADCLLSPVNDGKIQQGDPVIPLIIGHCSPVATKAAEHAAPHSISIKFNHTTLLGNTHQTLLEQLEEQGITLPYSCRSGICKQCSLTLVSGSVIPLNNNALQPHRQILSCSCIPLQDIEVLQDDAN